MKETKTEDKAEKKPAEEKIVKGGDSDALNSKPEIDKNIKFTDKIKILKYSSSSEIIKLLDGSRTIRDVCIELDKGPDEVIPLVEELREMRYIKNE